MRMVRTLTAAVWLKYWSGQTTAAVVSVRFTQIGWRIKLSYVMRVIDRRLSQWQDNSKKYLIKIYFGRIFPPSTYCPRWALTLRTHRMQCIWNSSRQRIRRRLYIGPVVCAEKHYCRLRCKWPGNSSAIVLVAQCEKWTEYLMLSATLFIWNWCLMLGCFWVAFYFYCDAILLVNIIYYVV